MGKRNTKAKQIKASIEGDIQELKSHIQDLEADILELHEENSELRRQIDLQADCFKELNSALWWEIKIHNDRFRFQRKQIREVKGAVEKEKEKLQEVTDAVIDIGTELEVAAETFLGRFIFKWFGKENQSCKEK